MEIGNNLKAARKRCKLSQEEVAEKLHVSRQAISRWETGKNQPDLESLIDLGRLYQTSIDELLGVEKEEISEYIEKNLEEEEEKSVKKAEQDWEERGMLFAVALVSCLMPLLGIIVPAVILWKYRKKKLGVLLRALLVMCIVLSIYNCRVLIQAKFFESYNVEIEAAK